QNLPIDVADVAQMIADSVGEANRVPLQFGRRDDGRPSLESWPAKRADLNANSVHPEDPVEPDALLHELRVGPEDLVPIAMPHARPNGKDGPASPQSTRAAEGGDSAE